MKVFARFWRSAHPNSLAAEEVMMTPRKVMKKFFIPVAITGVGAILPGAMSAPEAWHAIRSGKSQISQLPEHLTDSSGMALCGGRVLGFDPKRHLPGISERFLNRYSKDIVMTMSAVEEAARDSALTTTNGCDPNRVGIIASSSRGPIQWWSDKLVGRESEEGPSADLEEGILASLPGTPATLSAIRLGVRGLVTTLSNACVGGQQAIGLARDVIASGQADAIVVVGHEMPLIPEIIRIYTADGGRVLAEASGDPSKVMKPYDRRRDGFALGEGAVALVLENEQHARAQGRTVYCRVSASATFNEAAHATRMDLSGTETARLIEATARDAALIPSDLGYICGHGTATRYNDLAESRALRQVYGPEHAAPPLGSIKPIFGHLLGASGVLNAFATAMMLHEQCLAPTINCTDVDPECAHDHVQGQARPTTLHHAMSLSFAIGSQSSALLLEAA